jgi:hypothetical protein
MCGCADHRLLRFRLGLAWRQNLWSEHWDKRSWDPISPFQAFVFRRYLVNTCVKQQKLNEIVELLFISSEYIGGIFSFIWARSLILVRDFSRGSGSSYPLAPYITYPFHREHLVGCLIYTYWCINTRKPGIPRGVPCGRDNVVKNISQH